MVSNQVGNWTITNDGGTCVWEIFTPPYPNTYTLPPTATGGVFAADADDCGSGTTVLTTATLTNSINVAYIKQFGWNLTMTGRQLIMQILLMLM